MSGRYVVCLGANTKAGDRAGSWYLRLDGAINPRGIAFATREAAAKAARRLNPQAEEAPA
jgi:hypothetical protein